MQLYTNVYKSQILNVYKFFPSCGNTALSFRSFHIVYLDTFPYRFRLVTVKLL